MIIISSRKFRDSQQEYFRKALTEDVILTTVHHGCFKLVPVIEGEPRAEYSKPDTSLNAVTGVKPINETIANKVEISTTINSETETSERSVEIKEAEMTAEKQGESSEESGSVKCQTISDEAVMKPDAVNDFVDPSLYEAFPEIYAKKLEEERKRLEELRASGLKKFFKRITK